MLQDCGARRPTAEACGSAVTVLSCKATVQFWGKTWSQLPAVSLEQRARYLQSPTVPFCFLCQSGHNYWELPACSSQLQGSRYGGDGQSLCVGSQPRAALMGHFTWCDWYKLRSCCPGLAMFVPCPKDAGERAMGRGWERAASMLPLEQRPPRETALKLSLAVAVRMWRQKPWGLAGLQPAARGSEITACRRSPRRDIDACPGWRSSGEARLLLRDSASTPACLCLPVCLSVPPRGPWQHGVPARRSPAARQWLGFARAVMQWPRGHEQRGRPSALTQPWPF